MSKKTLVWTNQTRIVSHLTLILIFIACILYLNYKTHTPYEKEELNTVSINIGEVKNIMDVTPWPDFPETEEWTTYINKSLGVKIKYPSDEIVIYKEFENSVVFTTPKWSHAGYPAIGLNLEKAQGGIKAGQPNADAIVPTRINNAIGSRAVDDYPSAGYDIFLEQESGTGVAVRLFTYDDTQETTDLEERKTNLRLFNIMISTFEYLN